MTTATWPGEVNPDIHGFGLALFKCRLVFIVINCTLILPDNFTDTSGLLRGLEPFPTNELPQRGDGLRQSPAPPAAEQDLELLQGQLRLDFKESFPTEGVGSIEQLWATIPGSAQRTWGHAVVVTVLVALVGLGHLQGLFQDDSLSGSSRSRAGGCSSC